MGRLGRASPRPRRVRVGLSQPAPRLAVAVSGGADGLSLLRLARAQMPPSDVHALFVDHQTRPAVAQELAHVRQVCQRLGIALHALTVSPHGRGHQHWRDARLAALLGHCRDAGISRLWLGHHKDDSIETAAIRLLAGGPLTGLAGISARSQREGITIERPLLRTSARALRRCLMAEGESWTEDPSNRNPAFKRAVVRKVLSQAPSHPDAGADLVRRAGQWRLAYEDALARAWSLAADTGPQTQRLGAITLDKTVLGALPASLTAALLMRAARAAAGREQRLRHVDFASIDWTRLPQQAGGVLLLPMPGKILVARDASAIGEPQPLRHKMLWDQRFRLRLERTPPAGAWAVGAVRDHWTGGLTALVGPEVLRALPGIFDAGRLVAIPSLGVWRGETGPFWAANLRCDWTRQPHSARFVLEP